MSSPFGLALILLLVGLPAPALRPGSVDDVDPRIGTKGTGHADACRCWLGHPSTHAAAASP